MFYFFIFFIIIDMCRYFIGIDRLMWRLTEFDFKERFVN
jgi:hypothetical protein